MNALQSYLRHLIVTGLVLLIEETKFPLEGAAEAADVIALAVLGTLAWLAAKYGPILGRRFGLIAIACGAFLFLPSCADYPLTLRARADGAAVAYDATRGLVIEVDARSSK